MSQKLQNTTLAGAITATALLGMLLLAEPASHGQDVQAGPVVFAAPGQIVGGLRRDLSHDLDRRARRFESDMAAAGPAGEALAIASAAMASSVMEATLAAVLDGLGSHQAAIPAARAEDVPQADLAARSRSAMAMPYFSTASGTARAYGE